MRRLRALTLLALIGLVATLVTPPVGAQPSSDEVRDDLQTADQRLQDLQMDAASAVEDYNEARVALEEASADLEETERERDRLSGEVETLVEAAGDHARRLHKLGPTIELSSVFVGGDHTEIGARTAALGRILDGQRADLEGLEAARTSLRATEQRLEDQLEQARAREQEVADARAEVEATLAAQADEVEQLEAELSAAEDREAEAERRRAEERARRQAAAEQRAAEEQAAEEQAEEQATEEQATEEQATEEQSAEQRSTAGDDDGSSSSRDDEAESEPSPSTRQSASVAVDTALDQIGKPYEYGADGPDSYDCSGLTSYSWRAAGVDITRTSRSQWHATSRVSRSELQPGDLVFYSRDGTPSGIGHVAMYVGGGDIVEASRPGVPVRRSSSGLSRSDILGYGRP